MRGTINRAMDTEKFMRPLRQAGVTLLLRSAPSQDKKTTNQQNTASYAGDKLLIRGPDVYFAEAPNQTG